MLPKRRDEVADLALERLALRCWSMEGRERRGRSADEVQVSERKYRVLHVGRLEPQVLVSRAKRQVHEREATALRDSVRRRTAEDQEDAPHMWLRRVQAHATGLRQAAHRRTLSVRFATDRHHLHGGRVWKGLSDQSRRRHPSGAVTLNEEEMSR